MRFLIVILFLLISCGRTDEPVTSSVSVEQPVKPVVTVDEPTDEEIRQKGIDRIMEESIKFIGTPYVWGGSSNKGADCSGALYRIWINAGFRMKRTTARRMALKYPKTDDPKPGDFVFFDHGKGIAHVGILNKPDELKRMYHASSSRGFIDSEINDRYWRPKEVQISRVELWPIIPE